MVRIRYINASDSDDTAKGPITELVCDCFDGPIVADPDTTSPGRRLTHEGR